MIHGEMGRIENLPMRNFELSNPLLFQIINLNQYEKIIHDVFFFSNNNHPRIFLCISSISIQMEIGQEQLKSYSEEKQRYLEMCDTADKILSATGISDICTRCSTNKPYRRWSMTLGCCRGCRYLTPYGCSSRSLSCKIWFCSSELREKILMSPYRLAWLGIENAVRQPRISRKLFGRRVDGFRKSYDDLF